MTGNNAWVKAVKSEASNQCVEMRRGADNVELRDSKRPDDKILSLEKAAFAAWVEGAKKNEFD